MTKNKKLRLFIFVVLFLVLGFVREFVFTNTNIVLYNVSHNENYAVPFPVSLLSHFDYYTIYTAKWLFTAAFCLLFFLLQRSSLKLLFTEKIILKWLLYFYLMLILLSVLAFGIGYICREMETGYRFSRMFMGILQSPVPLMFLIPAGVFKNKFDKQS